MVFFKFFFFFFKSDRGKIKKIFFLKFLSNSFKYLKYKAEHLNSRHPIKKLNME